ncbi:MAG: CBS domain-containing protein [Thermoplasmatales archaeon]|nr:CBS domain-containing protein [Thermoplasmatales archaeon]MCK4995662.1 CBS domain-containing protein [Thermoplasmatales archaeon]
MSKKIIAVDSNGTVMEACNKFRDHKVGSLLVTEADQLVGILTERDVIKRILCEGRDTNATMVKEIMSTDIKTIGPLEEIEDALEVFKKYNIKKLPVMSDNAIVGIITITDIAYTRPGIKDFIRVCKE